MSTSYTIRTIPFKLIDDLIFYLDLYLPDSPPASASGHPVIFNFHPAGCTCGDRSVINSVVVERGIERNWALISFDYRLAPESQMPEMWSDCEDAWGWLHNDANNLLGGKVLDTSKIAVVGGYMALLAGYKLSPRPAAIFDMFAISAITNPFYCQPKKLSNPDDEIPNIVYKSALSDRPVLGSQCFIGQKLIREPRTSLYVYMIQKGIWTQKVIGLNPDVEEDAKKLLEWTPMENVDSHFPPTYVIHPDGQSWRAVPLKDSVDFVEALKRNEVDHKFVIVKDLTRQVYANFMTPGHPAWERIVGEAYIFLDKYLSPNVGFMANIEVQRS